MGKNILKPLSLARPSSKTVSGYKLSIEVWIITETTYMKNIPVIPGKGTSVNITDQKILISISFKINNP